MNDKKLFEIMIKYHPTIVGWLIHNRMFEQNKANNSHKQRNYEVYEVYYDGVKKIGYIYERSNDFVEFSYTNGDDYKLIHNYKLITEAGIDVYDIGNRHQRYCHISQLENLIRKHSDKILDLEIKGDHPRIKGEAIVDYIRIIERQIQFIKDCEYSFYYKNHLSHSFYYTIWGDELGKEAKKQNIIKYGIFANTTIYERIEWDFDLVEKYKDQLIWHLLINKSNLTWDEETIIKYDKYIFSNDGSLGTYCDKFKQELDYSKFNKLSNTFLKKYKDALEWRHFLKEGKFEWNGEDIEYFMNYLSYIDIPWSNSFPNTKASSQIDFTSLLDNKNFAWTVENLHVFLTKFKLNWKKLVDKHRPHIYSTLLQIPNIGEIANEHVKDIDDFWEIISYNKNIPYVRFVREFTLYNIIQNVNKWSEPLYDKLISQRTCTKYITYRVITKWDEFANCSILPLTYDIAKYLSNITIKLGGTYVTDEYGEEEKNSKYPIFNGLQAFSHHSFATTEDKILCLEDEKIVEILLSDKNCTSDDFISFIVEEFFKDYSIEDYMKIIDAIKKTDWCDIKQFRLESWEQWFLSKCC